MIAKTLCLSWMLCGAIPPAAAAQEPAAQSGDSQIAAARTFAHALRDGDYARAEQLLAPVMAEHKVNAGSLQQIWQQVRGRYGEFQSFGEPAFEAQGGFDLVYIPAHWETGGFRLRIVIDGEHRVCGFWFDPLEPPAPYEPPAYVRPETFAERELTVSAGGPTLPARLTLPQSDQRVPGVVLVHGSGPNDMDETIGPNKPFRDLAWGLATSGVASLRYDKRTRVSRDPEMLKEATFDEFVIDDALAALELLRNVPEVDAARTFVVGHSLGATLAPEICTRDGRVAGAVLLAGLARSFEDVIVDQYTYIYSLPDAVDGAEQLNDIRTQMRGVRNRSLPADERTILGPARILFDLCDRDAEVAVGHATRLPCPLLLIHGGRDYQVTRADYDLWREGLSTRDDATFKWFADLNHLFITGEGMATPGEYEQSGHVADRVIQTVAHWIIDVPPRTPPDKS